MSADLALAPSSTACRVCGSAEVACVMADASDHVTKEPFRILRCRRCEVAFTDPLPADLSRHYPSGYRNYGPAAMSALRALYSLRVSNWCKRFAQPGYALEIGCGPGLMLDALRRKGWRVKGIERTPEVARQAREALGLDVTSEDLATLSSEPTFDLIFLFQVLEHLPEPAAVVHECSRRLKPGGRLIINVPNLGSWQARFGRNVWWHLDPPRHLFHFTSESLRRLMERGGLDVVDVSYASLEHDVFGWVQTLVNRALGDYNTLTRYLMGLEPWSGSAFLSAALGACAAPACLLLSCASWAFNQGALMQLMAVRRAES